MQKTFKTEQFCHVFIVRCVRFSLQSAMLWFSHPPVNILAFTVVRQGRLLRSTYIWQTNEFGLRSGLERKGGRTDNLHDQMDGSRHSDSGRLCINAETGEHHSVKVQDETGLKFINFHSGTLVNSHMGN